MRVKTHTGVVLVLSAYRTSMEALHGTYRIDALDSDFVASALNNPFTSANVSRETYGHQLYA